MARERTRTDKEYVLLRTYADVDLASYLDPVCCSALRRLYEAEWATARHKLEVAPLSTMNVVLPRLERNHEEWRAEREEARCVYRDVAQRNHLKALDWQPKYKRLDKTRLGLDDVWRELVAAQCLLDADFVGILAAACHKRSALKEHQREQFRADHSPMDAASTIRPTKCKAELRQHVAEEEEEAHLQGRRVDGRAGKQELTGPMVLCCFVTLTTVLKVQPISPAFLLREGLDIHLHHMRFILYRNHDGWQMNIENFEVRTSNRADAL